MPRTRAGQAARAFSRVGMARVEDMPAGDESSGNTSLSASGNESSVAVVSDGAVAGDTEGLPASSTASLPADADTGVNESVPAGSGTRRKAGTSAARSAGNRASRSAGRKAGRPRRRVGRPRGPERVPLTIRILAATDERLTAAVEMTGESPQYIVDAALAAYLDALGVPGGRGSGRAAGR